MYYRTHFFILRTKVSASLPSLCFEREWALTFEMRSALVSHYIHLRDVLMIQFAAEARLLEILPVSHTARCPHDPSYIFWLNSLMLNAKTLWYLMNALYWLRNLFRNIDVRVMLTPGKGMINFITPSPSISKLHDVKLYALDSSWYFHDSH